METIATLPSLRDGGPSPPLGTTRTTQAGARPRGERPRAHSGRHAHRRPGAQLARHRSLETLAPTPAKSHGSHGKEVPLAQRRDT